MAIKKTDDINYTNIAEAIREKNGEQTRYMPAQMAQAIRQITGGGSGGNAPVVVADGERCYFEVSEIVEMQDKDTPMIIQNSFGNFKAFVYDFNINDGSDPEDDSETFVKMIAFHLSTTSSDAGSDYGRIHFYKFTGKATISDANLEFYCPDSESWLNWLAVDEHPSTPGTAYTFNTRGKFIFYPFLNSGKIEFFAVCLTKSAIGSVSGAVSSNLRVIDNANSDPSQDLYVYKNCRFTFYGRWAAPIITLSPVDSSSGGGGASGAEYFKNLYFAASATSGASVSTADTKIALPYALESYVNTYGFASATPEYKYRFFLAHDGQIHPNSEVDVDFFCAGQFRKIEFTDILPA